MATLTKSCQLVTNVVDKALAASDLKESGLYPSPSFQSTNRQPTFPSGQETSRTCTKDFLAPSTTRMTPRTKKIVCNCMRRQAQMQNEKGEWTTRVFWVNSWRR